MNELKVGQLRRWTIPDHPTYGKHDADGLVFRVVSIGEMDGAMISETTGPMANGEYVSGRVPWCLVEPEWMAANSALVEDTP